MSTTRRELKHKRDRRRAETEQLRTARRDTLSILLSRAQRGVLTRDEAALLRTHVEAELAEGDTARQSERGQQRAMERHRQRVEAAEAAIVEAEQRAEEAEQRLARIRDMADAWKRRLPAVIRTATAADAVRLAAGGDYRPVMFEVTADQAAAAADGEQHRAAEQRLAAQQQMHEDRRHALADALGAHVDTTWPQLVELARRIRHDAWANGRDCREEHERARRLEAELAAAREQHTAAEQRTRAAEQALDRVRQADTLGAAVAAVAEHDGMTPQAAAVHAAFTNAADSARARLEEQARDHAVELATERRAAVAAVDAWKRRAQEAEEEVAQQRARANGWRAHAVETDDRADRHLAAWRSARRRAREHAAEEQRVRGWCGHWHDRALAAEGRLDRLAAAWTNARARAATRTEERDRALALAAARGDALAAHLANTEAPR